MTPRESLDKGRLKLDPILLKNGFAWEDGGEGKSSGGHFARGSYVRGDRKLELHFRYALGLVTYHLAGREMSHQDFMTSLGVTDDARYPGFSEDPQEAFADLAHDLKYYGGDFLFGKGDEFLLCCDRAEERNSKSGYARIDPPEDESE